LKSRLSITEKEKAKIDGEAAQIVVKFKQIVFTERDGIKKEMDLKLLQLN